MAIWDPDNLLYSRYSHGHYSGSGVAGGKYSLTEATILLLSRKSLKRWP